MDSFENIVELRNAWKEGKFTFSQSFTIAGIIYRIYKSSNFTFEEIIMEGKRPALIYHTNKEHKHKTNVGLQQWIVFVWTPTKRTSIIPYDVYPISPQRYVGSESTGFKRSSQMTVGESQERIGDVVIMKVFLPSGTVAIKGRVDTGAEISSLHADDFKVVGEMVKFSNNELSKNIITAPLADQQQVKSADGGIEYRPVIELNVEINGKMVRNVLFNLNNRDQMEYPCLIGQNVLEKTNFLIDPKIDGETSINQKDGWIPEGDYEVNWNLLQEDLLKEVKETPPDVMNSILQTMVETNMTLPELIKYVRTDALQDSANYNS